MLQSTGVDLCPAIEKDYYRGKGAIVKSSSELLQLVKEELEKMKNNDLLS
ncbi:hypothetical protein [Scytonema hofmannii]|nr:hypothetical protein [Scytonema hofmannii]